MYNDQKTTGMSDKNDSSRSGVTLLIVLGLMTMFALLVVAFMVITTQARRTAEHAARTLVGDVRGTADSGHSFASSNFEPALEKLLIGDKIDSNTKNVIAPHSILENLYGHPNYEYSGSPTQNLEGTITNNTAQGTTGYIDVSVTLKSNHDYDDYTQSDLIGNIITVTEISATPNSTQQQIKGKSTFILDVPGNIRIAPFVGVTLGANDLSGCTFIINSPAFSGTGPGFDSSTAATVAALSGNDGDTTSKPYALRPNILAPNNDGTQAYKTYLNNTLVLMNPDYTAPDYLNMFLAWNNVQYNVGDPTAVPPVPPYWYINNIIPSFHRPQLVNYWGTTDPNELRKIVLRPLPTDHPNFTGSNPAAILANLSQFLTQGPWDVDNDGDGIADGIWLDVGLGTTTIGGTTYKKLVSYYVLDMDGRLNVNVHGNLEHNAALDTFTDPMGTDSGGLQLRGSGSGVAEVRLDSILGDAHFRELLEGKDADNDGRYGKFTDKIPGATGVDDGAAALQMYENAGVRPEAYGHLTNTAGLGGMIPDWRGVFPITFDPLGNRYFDPAAITGTNDIYAGNPYLLNPYAFNDDNPFDASDLQYLLRSVSDVDYTNLPKRLRNLLGESVTDQYNLSQNRLILGTRSSDIPVFSKLGGTTSGTSSATYRGLYSYIFYHIFGATTPTDTTAQGKTDNLFALLPEEIRRGEKINLNRLTLRIDWTTGGTDLLEAKARFAQEIFYLLAVLSYDQIEKNNYLEGLPNKAAVYTRLAQWSVNLVDFIDPDATMTPFVFSTAPFGVTLYDNATDIETIASSSDWSSSGTISLIWGMEKPEVALTETFAVHNRRVADSIGAANSTDKCDETGCIVHPEQVLPKTPTPTSAHLAKHDKHFDQVLRPQGSLFVELYRQGNPHRTTYPQNDIIEPDGSLNLAKKTAANGDYIWRLVITEETTKSVNSDEFKWGMGSNQQWDALYQMQLAQNGKTYSCQTYQWNATSTIGQNPGTSLKPDRFIWFGNGLPPERTSKTDIANNIKRRSYYRTDSTQNVVLNPNSYLVIGPREETSFASTLVNDSQPTFGIHDGSSDAKIDLTSAGLNLPTGADSNAVSIMTATMDSLPNVGVNVSEPLPTISGSSLIDGYDSFSIDKPVDGNELQCLGTIPCYRTICLQRLADPAREHHPITNPYITVDWNMIDLQVINSEKDGRSKADEQKDVNQIDMISPAFKFQKDKDMRFVSRQWGNLGHSVPTDFTNLWDRSLDSSADTTKAGLPDWNDGDTTSASWSAQKLVPETTFGYLNSYGNTSPSFISSTTLTNLANKGIDTTYYPGLPAKPFLHFPWHDTPLANSYELMLVPATPPGRFGVEFYDNKLNDLFGDSKSLGIGTTTTPPRFSNPNLGIGPYLNFFHSTAPSLDLSRLFEYVRVPSKFAGTVRGWIPDGSNTYGTPIYEMREPGKINLNTATEPAWEALSGSTQRTWHDYTNGNGDGLFDLREAPANYPSEFVPFRSPQAVNLVPPLSTTLGFNENDLVQDPGNTTLLRKSLSGDPLLESEPTPSNPYTALENVMRLSDMTTTRSNVFAVWMTIGYFEAEKFDNVTELQTAYPGQLTHINTSNFSAVYPDGYVLGAEKGLDNGTVKRHRAFYLIDRSTPVGFRRGEVFRQENGDPHYKPVIVGSKILE
ncbi:MAG: hypothetical protein LBQ50_00135 [Planctomycetaceae bacterium]|jgi:hypothetical protein|nr:hypothetical protein [Planctomycetaceae bacterium]